MNELRGNLQIKKNDSLSGNSGNDRTHQAKTDGQDRLVSNMDYDDGNPATVVPTRDQ